MNYKMSKNLLLLFKTKQWFVHGFQTCCIVITVLLCPGLNLQAQSNTYKTDVSLIYDFNCSGALIGGRTWINANNDTFIDYWVSRTEGASLYTPTNTGQYNSPDIDPIITFKETPYNIDYNNDGLIDFLILGQRSGTIYTRNYKGEYMHEKQILMSPEQYMGEREDLVLDNYMSPFLKPGGMYIPPASNVKAGVPMLSIDLNGDGLPDSYNDKNGIVFQSTKEGILISSNLGGSINVRDFNGDGLIDYVYYDKETFANSLRMLNSDGSITEHKLLERVCSGGRVWCYDFDHDNDVDILIPVDYQQYYSNSTTNGATTINGVSAVLLAENQGDGTFKKHEFTFNGKIYFIQCFDSDADGRYELYAFDDIKDRGSAGNIISYRINGMSIEDSPKILYSNVNYSYERKDMLIADFNLQGKAGVIYYDRENFDEVLVDLPDSKENTAPNKPDAPQYTYDSSSGLLKITWNASSDTESTAADLSYALRIGTEKDSGNMLYAHARADGTRRNLLDGNCGFSTMRTVNVSSWPAGKYYISVQAVDPGHRGSAFSESVAFQKSEASADFILSYDPIAFGVGDTCRIALRYPKENGCSYKWDLAGGEILSQSDENSDMYVAFHTKGTKNISLQVTNANGVVSKVTKNVEVAPVGIKEFDGYSFDISIDLDGDGTAELYNSKFYQLNEDGSYGTVNKLWNATLPQSSTYDDYIVDLNRDGYPDIQKLKYNIINEGDMQIYVEELEKYLYDSSDYDYILDMDNDGDMDNVSKGRSSYFGPIYAYISENVDGNYKKLKEHTMDNMISVKPIDYDKDGLIDFCAAEWNDETEEYRHVACINNGDFTFSPISTSIKGTNVKVIDADGDGTWDNFYNYDSSDYGISIYAEKIDVEWGDGTVQSIPCPDGCPFRSAPSFYDLDNNGCMDMIAGISNGGVAAIYYFNKDHSYTMEIFDSGIGDISLEFNYVGSKRIVGNYILSGITNNRPKAPTALRSSQTSNAVVIEWEHSVDAETPAALMRYNISIKRKGATGENAYIISPLNMDNDEAELPSPIQLLETNKITIPLTSIPAGEYEVKVQGVDRWYYQSKFSQVYDLTVEEVIVPGDVNKDYRANITDVVLTGNYILLKNPDEFDFGAADVNKDGKITMSDIVLIIDLIFKDNSPVDNIMTRNSASDYITIANATEDDAIVTLPIAFNNSQPYTAFQMDIKLPEGVTLLSAELTARANNNHKIVYRQLTDGNIRLIGYSPDNMPFKGNSGDLITLQLDHPNVQFAEQDIEISNVIFVTPEGKQNNVVGNTTSIFEVESDGMKMTVRDGLLLIDSNKMTVLPLYNIQGVLVNKLSVQKGKNVYRGLSSGVYILNRQKIVIK